MAESKTDYAEPEYAQKQDKSKVPYYRSSLADRITPEVGYHLALNDSKFD